jgi:TonB family protein
MAWEEHLAPDLLDEAPFFVAALIVYAGLFVLDPTIRWGARERAPDRSVPIEFVAQLPAPSPNLAPAVGGGDDRMPRHGPGEYVPEKVRAGAPQAAPKPNPSPKPAPVRAKPRPHALAGPPTPRPVVHKPAPDPQVLAAQAAARAERARVLEAAREQAAQDKAARLEAAAEARREAAAKHAAAVEAARQAAHEKAEAAKAAAEAAREAAREKAAAAKAEADRRAAERREKQRQLAEARAEAARKKAELAQQLATMADPDEALDAGTSSGNAAASAGPAAAAPKASAAAASGSGSAAASSGGLAGARKASAAAALADAAEPTETGDTPGRGGADLLDAKAKGGGSGPDGSGVSWTMDGPVGSRRVLKRAAPTSPDWVGARGLDLTVTVRFQVLPTGRIKPGSVIQKTSGFPEIDRRALDALGQWRFEPAVDAPETWGRVTFRFTSS